MALDYFLAEVNMQPKGVIYFYSAGASLSNETPNLDEQSWGSETHPQRLKKPSAALKSKQMSSTGKEELCLSGCSVPQTTLLSSPTACT